MRGAADGPVFAASEGKVERLHRTIGEGLIATLPHYTGGPRRANGKLYAQPAPLTLPQLQTRVREFIDAYNTEHRHSSLGGMTPAEKWATSAAPLDLVEPERLRWMLMADQTRKVDKDGIHFENAIFIAPEITRARARQDGRGPLHAARPALDRGVHRGRVAVHRLPAGRAHARAV